MSVDEKDPPKENEPINPWSKPKKKTEASSTSQKEFKKNNFDEIKNIDDLFKKANQEFRDKFGFGGRGGQVRVLVIPATA